MIEVVAGVIVRNGRLVLARRKKGDHLEGRWEFPGGKIEEGEDCFSALVREIEEELGIRVRPVKKLFEVVYEYPEKTVRLHFVLAEAGEAPRALDCGAVGEFLPEEVSRLDLAPADRVAWERMRCTISSLLG